MLQILQFGLLTQGELLAVLAQGNGAGQVAEHRAEQMADRYDLLMWLGASNKMR
ncbi:hypothetical protein [Aeromonas hydrophila]|uniref:hypothetical protein n=1 Tax=Aeromonas hydrophila TaxID=644 RepID=UPI003F7AFE39